MAIRWSGNRKSQTCSALVNVDAALITVDTRTTCHTNQEMVGVSCMKNAYSWVRGVGHQGRHQRG
eukprot:1157498-Pelagomonas_calceolata.AAC.4